MNTPYRSRLIAMARPVITPRPRSRFEPAALGPVDAGLSTSAAIHESSTSTGVDHDLEERAARLTTRGSATSTAEVGGDHRVVADSHTSPTVQRTPAPASTVPDPVARSSATAADPPAPVEKAPHPLPTADHRLDQGADVPASTSTPLTPSPRSPGFRSDRHVVEPRVGAKAEPRRPDPVADVRTVGRAARVTPTPGAPIAGTSTPATAPAEPPAMVDEPARVTAASDDNSASSTRPRDAYSVGQRTPSPADSPDSAQVPPHVRRAGELTASWAAAPRQPEIDHSGPAQRDTERHDDNVEIQVRIGRIEVRTGTPAAPPASQRKKEAANTSSLSDYLRARSQGRAG